MYFQTLQDSLLQRVKQQVRNGELTERGLARLAGISQPHLHNVLKGVRVLTPGTADRLLQQLRLSVLDLMEYHWLVRHLASRQPEDFGNREIPVLAGRLGPGLPWPVEVSLFERYPVSCQRLERVTAPIMVRLGVDSRMNEVLTAGDLMLLDQAEEIRSRPDARALYAIQLGGEGVVRWVRSSGRYLYLVAADAFNHPWAWERIPLGPEGALKYVRARAIPVTRRRQRLTIQREDPVQAMTSR